MSAPDAPPDGGTTVVYRGWLRHTGNGEKDDLLAVPTAAREADRGEYGADDDRRFLAAAIAADIETHGRFLTVRLWTSMADLTGEQMREYYLLALYGAGHAQYEMHYSEDTGYLYTDETLTVGGHDLLAKLERQVGWFAHLEITYHRTPRT